MTNLVHRVHSDFSYNEIWDTRQSDTTLLGQRGGDIALDFGGEIHGRLVVRGKLQ